MMRKYLLLSRFLLATALAFPASGCTVYTTPPSETALAFADAPPPPPAAYVWVGGRYERLPHPGARYVHGHWEHRGRRTLWVDGRWG